MRLFEEWKHEGWFLFLFWKRKPEKDHPFIRRQRRERALTLSRWTIPKITGWKKNAIKQKYKIRHRASASENNRLTCGQETGPSCRQSGHVLQTWLVQSRPTWSPEALWWCGSFAWQKSIKRFRRRWKQRAYGWMYVRYTVYLSFLKKTLNIVVYQGWYQRHCVY